MYHALIFTTCTYTNVLITLNFTPLNPYKITCKLGGKFTCAHIDQCLFLGHAWNACIYRKCDWFSVLAGMAAIHETYMMTITKKPHFMWTNDDW